jgi:hypothetical protein
VQWEQLGPQFAQVRSGRASLELKNMLLSATRPDGAAGEPRHFEYTLSAVRGEADASGEQHVEAVLGIIERVQEPSEESARRLKLSE